MSIRDAARSELTHLSDDIALLRVENDSLKRGMQESSCGSRLARPNFEGEDMEIDSFPTTGMMTPSASTWMSSTPPMVECSTAGLAVPVVTYATEDLSRARVENGHRGTRSSAGREPSLEDFLMAGHAGRSHPASPEVPESVNSRDPPSSTTQETVVGNLADEFCTDKQESPSAKGADISQFATSARRLTDAAVLASAAGSCDADKASEDMPKAHDEMRLEVFSDAAEGPPEAVSPQAPDTAVDVPDFAVDESPQEVLGEAAHDVPSRTVHGAHSEAISDAEPEDAREWDMNALASPTIPFPPHAKPAQTASVTSPASLAETPAGNMIAGVSTGSPMPPSSQGAPPIPDLMPPPQDELDTEVSSELSEPDQDAEPLVEISDSRSSSPTAMAQADISSGVPASHETAVVEDSSSNISSSTTPPFSSLADESETLSPTMLPGDDSVEIKTNVPQSPSALKEATRLPMPHSLASDASQIEVALEKGPETPGTRATDEEVTTVDNANSSNAAPSLWNVFLNGIGKFEEDSKAASAAFTDYNIQVDEHALLRRPLVWFMLKTPPIER
ncbi:hypothetical protein B0A54_15992 [Friedmanniomyces endolithicus]|uniref:Uncharacterized protein n=1 Tax=Friedmanniomyces endolithicus TaxID=329885 RepID=A0A4U0U2S2_9PEZI|nr:hypothetical protein B0A54_15992 [Friedmanniomyces endolithicus]